MFDRWTHLGTCRVGTGALTAKLEAASLPRHEVHWRAVRGRSGVLATQALEFVADDSRDAASD